MSGARHLMLAGLAAILALGLGLALGAGPVVGTSQAGRAERADRLAGRVDRLSAEITRLRGAARTDAKVVGALAAPLTRERMAGRSVVLFRTPGATDALVRSTRDALLGSGASLTGTLTLAAAYLDPAKATAPLEDLVLRLVPPGVEFTPGATAIERVGIVLARSTVTTADPEGADRVEGLDQDAAEVIAGLDELGALTLDGDPGRLAELAVVVAGQREQAEGAAALTALLRALDAGSAGTVLATPGPADVSLGWARTGGAAGGASTVDTAGAVPGRVALVLAAVEQAAGGRGDYGVGPGATAVLPESVLSTTTGG